jgi:outer membrane protein
MNSPRSLAAAALVALAGALFALPSPARADTKVAYVDLQRALTEIDEGKAARAALKEEFDQKQKMLDDRKGEFEKMRGDFEKQSSLMSDDARKEKQGEIERKGNELQGFFMQQQKELSDREREMTRGIFEKMSGIVHEIAEAEGVSLVVQSEALVYAAPSLDLTNELVRKYNTRYKGGAAPTPAAKKDSGSPDKKASAKKEGK